MSQLSQKLSWELANPKWAAEINPILALPILNGKMITGIRMATGVQQAINHKLQRKPIGWIIVDNDDNSNIWRTKEFNDLTLTLESNDNTTISIWVF